MIDILQICKDFCEDNDLAFVLESPKGINISADQLMQDKVLFWLNVIESGSIDMDTYGDNVKHERNIEIVMFRDCNLEDEGEEYYRLLDTLRTLSVKFYVFMLNQGNDSDTFSSFMTENGVDQLDHNCVMQLIRFSVTEISPTCDNE